MHFFLGSASCLWSTVVTSEYHPNLTLDDVSVRFWKSGQLKEKDGACFLRVLRVLRAIFHLLIFSFMCIF